MDEYDVVVIGGGPAGLSGAVALGRSRRTVLVMDDGTPRNAPAAGVHNFLTRDGTPPGELLAAGRAEVASYGGEVRSGRAVGAERVDGALVVRLADGTAVRARRLLVTTGLTDVLPDVPGLAERWGRDVLHCPYCHGWEVRDQAIGVLACGPMAVHQALMLRQLSADVTFFQHDAGPLGDDEREQLTARGIPIVDGEVVGLAVADDRLTGVRLADGRTVAVDALGVQPVFTARTELLDALGLVPTDMVVAGHVIGRHIAAGMGGTTDAPGVYVAGNVAEPMAQVMSSAAAGLFAGAAINGDLVTEDTAVAVAALREKAAAGV
jgi:thioredoxin reductase (NADPH)